MIKTAVVSLLVLPHFIAYPANKYEKLARINRYRSLGRFIIQNSQQLQLQQSWSIQLTSKSMLGAQKVCEGTQCVTCTTHRVTWLDTHTHMRTTGARVR